MKTDRGETDRCTLFGHHALVGAPDPELAVLEHLARPAGVWELGPETSHGVRSAFVRGGNPEQADLSTVRFVKHRRSEHRHIYFVRFDGTHPRLGPLSFDYVYPVEPDPDGGWRVFGGAGGAGDVPARSAPWVNLGGGGWPDRFYAGGHVDAAGRDVDRVELRFANGVTLADDAEGGVALFITEESVELPAVAVLFDPAGAEVGRHEALSAY